MVSFSYGGIDLSNLGDVLVGDAVGVAVDDYGWQTLDSGEFLPLEVCRLKRLGTGWKELSRIVSGDVFDAWRDRSDDACDDDPCDNYD